MGKAGRSVIFMFLLTGLSLNVKADFDFNADCIKAYKSILSLKLKTAKVLIDDEKRKNPQNAIPYLLDNYLDYFTLLTTDNRADLERLKSNKSARLSRIEKDDKNSPYYLFAQAEINLQLALSRSRFQEYFTSAIEINRAFSQLQENSRKFPSFLPNQKNLGMIHVILGSVPDGLRRAMSAFGIRGDMGTGLKMLEQLVSKLPQSDYRHFTEEAVFYLASVQTDILNDPSYYNDIIANTGKINSESLMRSYIRAYAGIRMGRNQDAITTLSRRPSGTAYQPYPYLDYLMGIARNHALDPDASSFFHGFLKNYKGVNFIKDAYLNLAWLELIKGNIEGYEHYIQQVKIKGFTVHEKDKQAVAEAGDPIPDTGLLKSRLLFDGGYYEKALSEISGRKMDSFRVIRDKIEYCYRLGRIYDEMSRDEHAIRFYQFAIDLGRNERYYFASNAAVRIAAIYEKRKDFAKARQFYRIALDMKNHDYENSIENKAKEGLKRMGVN